MCVHRNPGCFDCRRSEPDVSLLIISALSNTADDTNKVSARVTDKRRIRGKTRNKGIQMSPEQQNMLQKRKKKPQQQGRLKTKGLV